jgi:hypothetical protein
MSLSRSIGFLVCQTYLFLTGELVHAQPDAFCDAGLRSPANDHYGYRSRGDRCEGRYFQNDDGTSLTLMSFTRSSSTNYAVSEDAFTVHWEPFHLGDLRIRAASLREDVHYRMDTTSAENTTSFSWPADIVNQVGLSPGDVGVVAWTSHKVGQSVQELYLPVAVTLAQSHASSSLSTQSRGAGLDLLVMPGTELKELYVSIYRLKSDGSPARTVRNEKALQLGYYPSRRGIHVEVQFSELSEPGIYFVQLSAEPKRGSQKSLPIYFFFPG